MTAAPDTTRERLVPEGGDQYPIERLGSQVWDTLTDAGHTPAPEGRRADGFDVLRPVRDEPVHVVVIARLDGILGGLPPVVHRRFMYGFQQTLDLDGFATRMVKDGTEPVVLVAALDEQSADAGADRARTTLRISA